MCSLLVARSGRVFAWSLIVCSSVAFAGDGVWTTSYPFGGSIASAHLVADPATAGVLYAAPLWRGVYRSLDGGVSWSPRLDDAPVAFDAKHVGALTVDASGTLYLASRDGQSGRLTLLASTDGGAAWSPRDAGVLGDVTALAFAPGSPQVAYLGTRQGEVFRSDDGAASWSLAAAGLPADDVRSLEVDPTDAQTVFAGTLASGLYRSLDGGASWSNVNQNVVMTTVEDIAIDPSAPATIYAADNDSSSGQGKALFKSTDGAATWSRLDPFMEFGGTAGRLIALDPADPQHVLAVAGNEILSSTDGGATWSVVLTADGQLATVIADPLAPLTFYAGSFSEGIFKSTDGGLTWSSSHGGMRGLHTTNGKPHSVVFDAAAPATIYAGTLHRGYRSSDGGATWLNMDHPAGVLIASFATHAAAPGLVYASQNDLWRSSDFGASWQPWTFGALACCFSSLDVAVHPADPSTLYVAGWGSAAAADGVYKSIDGGLVWSLMNSGLSEPRIHTLTVDPSDGDTLYAGVANDFPSALFKSTDGAATWTQLGGGLPAQLNIHQIVVHPLDGNRLYLAAASSPGAGVYRSTDGGSSWQLLFVDNVNAMAVDPTDLSKVYAGTWNTAGFYRSTDGGDSWALINDGLPLEPGIDSLAVDPLDPDRILAGTAGGVYELTFAGSVDFTVTNLGDSGPRSLRDALTQANQDGVPNVIRFDPQLAGATLRPQSPLPPLAEGGTTLDGDLGGDCVPDIAIGGELAGGSNGLDIVSSNNVIRGLAIGAFAEPPGDGILIAAPAGDNVVECSYIGVDLGGQPWGNGFNGIKMTGGTSGNRIGPGNRVAFNPSFGVWVEDGLDASAFPDFTGRVADHVSILPQLDLDDGCGFLASVGGSDLLDSTGAPFADHVGGRFTGSLEIAVAGDYVLTLASLDDQGRLVVDGSVVLDAAGGGAEPSPSVSVSLTAGSHDFEADFFEGGGAATWRLQIDGPAATAFATDGNLGGCAAAQPGLCGELFQLRLASEGNTITENAIAENGNLGIATSCCCGPTLNDPGDADIGPNGLLNWPDIAASDDLGGGAFSLDGTAAPGATVEIFAARPDPSGFGEGDIHLATTTADAGGAWNAAISLPPGFFFVSATATDGSGNTSEFSPAFLVTANQITVTSAADSGPGSLRDAIDQANADGAPSVIRFDPALAGGTIQLFSELPAITGDDTIIDGDLGEDCQPDIALDGGLVGCCNGLSLESSGNLVQGLAIGGFPIDGLAVRGGSGNVIRCNFIGTGLDGVSARGNGNLGIAVHGGATGNRIGPANVVAWSGNAGVGILEDAVEAFPGFAGLTPDAAQVFPVIDFTDGCGSFESADGIVPTDSAGQPFTENFGGRFTGTLSVGTAGDYSVALANPDDRVRVVIDAAVVLEAGCCDDVSSLVALAVGDHAIEIDFFEGGGAASLRPMITGPGPATFSTGGQPGLFGELFQLRIPTEGNTITENAISDNGGLGIGFSCCCGPTPNDPGDADIGPNGLLNWPEIGAVTDLGGGSFAVDGTAPPDARIELFGAAPDPSGFGEGKAFVGAVTADPAGSWNATVSLPPALFALTTTATDAAGNTSEFSAVTGAKSPDEIAIGDASGFQGEVVPVPIFVRDLAATELGIDQPAGRRIQGFSVQVRFAPAAGIAAVSGARAGLTAGLAPLFEQTVVAGDMVTYVASFDEVSDPLAFGLDAPPPGDLVAELLVTLAPLAPLTPIAVALLPAGSALVNQAGRLEETAGAGSLRLSGGTLTVRTRAASALIATGQSASAIRLAWSDPDAGESGFRVERSQDGNAWAAIATLGADQTSHIDTGLDAATLYFYRVVSLGPGGDNPPSNVATAETFPAAGAQVCATQLSSPHAWARLPSPARGAASWAAVYHERQGTAQEDIRFQHLSPDGAPVGVPVALTANDMQSQYPALRWNGTRFGALWSEHMRGPGGEITSNQFFSLLDAAGQTQRGPVRLFDSNDTFFLNSNLDWAFAWDGAGWGLFHSAVIGAPSTQLGFWRFAENGERLLGPIALTGAPGDVFDVSSAWSGSEHGVAWVHQDGSDDAVMFQRVLADGTAPAGAPGPVVLWQSTPGTSAQVTSTVWDGSGWAVAWSVFAGDESAIQLRRVGPGGLPAGPVERLSEDFDSTFPPTAQVPVDDELPVLEVLPGGGYACFATSFAGASGAFEIGRLEADAAGVRSAARSFVSDVDGAHSSFARAAGDGGSFLIAYNDHRQGTQEAAAVRVAPDGTTLSGPHDLTSGHHPGNASFLATASFAQLEPLAGGLVAVWADNRGGVTQLQAQLYDAAGLPAARLAPLSTRGVRGFPGLAALGSSFAVAWKTASQSVVFARFDAAGQPQTGEVEIATGAGGRGMAAVAWSGEVYGVAWYHGGELVLQRVAPDGSLVGGRTTITSDIRANPISLQWVGAGWAVVWQAGDGDLRYALVDAFGGLAAAPTAVTATGEVAFRQHLLFTGEHLGLVWLDAAPDGNEIFFERLGLDGSVLAGPLQVVAATSFHQPKLSWRDDRFHLLRAGATAPVPFLDGVVVDEILPDGTIFSAVRRLTNRGGPQAASFDGTTGAVVWSQLRELFIETEICLADTTPPPCPSLSIGGDVDAVRLTWSAVDDAETGIYRYNLYRDGTMLAELFPKTTSHDDRGARPGFVHGYEVRALNPAFGESPGCPVRVYSTITGDVNGDGFLTTADLFYLLNFLFAGGAPPQADADANGDDAVTIADLFFLINFFFGGGPPPAGPEAPLQPTPPAGAGADTLAIGSTRGPLGAEVRVPITIRDRAGTPLSEGDGGNREIQGFAARVDFAPASAITDVRFEPAGITAGLAAVSPIVLRRSDHVVVLINFRELTAPLAFNLEPPPPGDVVGALVFTLAPSADAGTVIALSLDPATATLVGDDATISETVALGSLITGDGSILVETSPTVIFADGFETGDASRWSNVVP